VIGETAVVLVDFEASSVLADDVGRRRDRAQMLVTTSAAVGNDRALAAARRIMGDELLLDALPLLQAAVMGRGLQQDARSAKVKLGRLRSDAADALGVKSPEVERLQRVSWGSIAMAALTLFAAYALITALTDIGLDTIADEMSNAQWSWVLVAFVCAQLTNVGEYISLAGVVGFPIPFGPTIMFRYALSFISLAVPSEAGTIAMNIRYQQKLGVPAAAAVAQGPLLTVFSKGFDVILLIVSACRPRDRRRGRGHRGRVCSPAPPGDDASARQGGLRCCEGQPDRPGAVDETYRRNLDPEDSVRADAGRFGGCFW
jgi:hypothetical protein